MFAEVPEGRDLISAITATHQDEAADDDAFVPAELTTRPKVDSDLESVHARCLDHVLADSSQFPITRVSDVW